MIKIFSCSLYIFFISIIFSQHAFAVTCEFEITNEWNSGFTSSVTLFNETQSSVDGWSASIEFADGSTISHIWNASLSGQTPYQASQLSYNQTIAPSSSVSFGFNTQKSTSGTAAQIPLLGGICISDSNNQPQAVATASTLQGPVPLTVDFNATQSTDPDGDDLSYLWQFNDGSSTSDSNTTHTFTEAGVYTVALTVDDGQLSSSTNISINAQSPDPASAQCQYILTNEWGSGFTSHIEISNVAEHAINAWSVDIQFPDDSASITNMWDADLSGQNPYQVSNKNYNGRIEPGQTVSFGFNSNKSTYGDPAQAPVLAGICTTTPINNPPEIVATVSPQVSTVPFTVTFDASQSSDPENDEFSYSWDFGDDQPVSDAVTTKNYTQAGTYSISLTLTDSHQATSTQQFTVTAQEPVVANAYTLDGQSSSLFFVSTKNVHIIEAHTFTQLAGDISPAGETTVRINLDSVESGIDIRNERMRNLLFETSLFNEATVSLDNDMAIIESLPIGETIEQSINPIAALHGVNAALLTQVSITRLSADTLLVQNLTPLLMNAGDFDLVEGIEALRELAGLNVISYSIPVNFTLIFNKQ